MNPTPTPDLREQLSRDHNGALRAALCARLATLQASLRAELRRLHPPDRYRRIEAAARAADAALETLQTIQIPRSGGAPSGLSSRLA